MMNVRLIQFELAHHRVMTNALVLKRNLVATPTYSHCLEVETIMIDCPFLNVLTLFIHGDKWNYGSGHI